MIFALGVVLFALGIGVSIMLHEAGHMLTAKKFGMKVTQYFVGFGPTLWSFQRGETEYGIKAIPAGGFCKIEGMTPLEEEQLEPRDQPRAFFRQKLWQRTIVLSAGSLTHFVLGIVLLYAAAVWVGLPNPALNNPEPVIGNVAKCVQPYDASDPLGEGKCTSNDPVAPALKAGLQPGDRIVSINGTSTPTWQRLVDVTQHAGAGPATITYLRDGQRHTTTADLVVIRRAVGGTVENPKLANAATLGVTLREPKATVTYGALDGLGPTASYTSTLFTGTFQAIGKFPEKVPKLLDALNGGKRDPGTPISVYGASRLGGDVVAHGGAAGWSAFLLILASLNIFIGIFNLFPLLPLDGGHIAVVWFERARSWVAARLGKPDPGRVDYAKLMPLTYLVIIVFGGLSVLTIATDIVNPIRLFQ